MKLKKNKNIGRGGGNFSEESIIITPHSKNDGFLEESLVLNGKSKEKKSKLIKTKKTKPVKVVKESALQSSDDDDDDDDEGDVPAAIVENGKNKKSKKIKELNGKKNDKKSLKNHKSSLNKLKSIDPEFYKFLEDNDKKLLNFNANDLGDDDDDDDDDENVNDNEDDDEMLHKPKSNLELASDESDFDQSDDENGDRNAENVDQAINEENSDDEKIQLKGGSQLITLKMLKKWQTELQNDKIDIVVIKNVILAVNSALLSISGENVTGLPFKVEGSAVFNGVLQLCVLNLHPAVNRYLGLMGRTTKKPHKCKKWNKIRTSLRDYLIDLTKLLEHISSSNILIVLLKHFHQIANIVASFATLTKPILKRLISLWSTSGEETVRVLSFLSILKITRGQQTAQLNNVLKAMYLAYVRNAKFVSPQTLPAINFMRRSLAEMFALDLNISYQHVFLYIRQLAIHLRNAITLRKKDSFQAVYNWQFINSLRLWTELLAATYNKKQLQPLIFPLVSIITGVIKLIPTAQYFPLRFHCSQILIQLSKETGVFIPILPFILETLNSRTFNKKHSKVSMKPMQFTCILRLNNAQLLENGFRDEVIENVHSQVLEYLAAESSTLGFPELSVSAYATLKKYCRTTKNSNYRRKLKVLTDKIQENVQLIEMERDKIQYTLKDIAQIAGLEATIRNRGTPLQIYQTNWAKTIFNKKKRHATDSENINDYNLPTIKKQSGNKKKSDGPVDLFPSDGEDDDDVDIGEFDTDDEDSTPPTKRQKVDNKKPSTVAAAAAAAVPLNNDDDFVDDGVDIVKDLDLDDW